MSTPQFSRPGAVDLSALKQPQSGSASGGSYVLEITSEEQLRTEVVQRSMSAVVIVSFWSPDSAASVQINDTLSAVANSSGGRFLFATLDVSAHADLAQALGIPQAPLVVAALRGQLAPLIQEPLPEQQMRQVVDQVLQAAASNGVSGTVDPVGGTDEPEEDTGEPEAKHPEAEDALVAGDVDAAVSAYQKALDADPADEEARLGLARAHLLGRTQGTDLQQARQAAADAPDDVAAQTLVADLDVVGGHVEDAFTRLIDLVRRTSGDDRDAARTHLLELFSVVGDTDPRVGKARQSLASALF